jgi:predicted nucleic acid-binding protein
VTTVYVDTSGVMRYLLQWRIGHRTARQVWDEADDVASVSLTYVETRAALAAARRNRSLTAPGLEQAKSAWETLWDELTVLEVDEPMVRAAGELAEVAALRGYDAVHLTAAHASGCDLLVSADIDLCTAGRRRGLAVLDLNENE